MNIKKYHLLTASAFLVNEKKNKTQRVMAMKAVIIYNGINSREGGL